MRCHPTLASAVVSGGEDGLGCLVNDASLIAILNTCRTCPVQTNYTVRTCTVRTYLGTPVPIQDAPADASLFLTAQPWTEKVRCRPTLASAVVSGCQDGFHLTEYINLLVFESQLTHNIVKIFHLLLIIIINSSITNQNNKLTILGGS